MKDVLAAFIVCGPLRFLVSLNPGRSKVNLRERQWTCCDFMAKASYSGDFLAVQQAAQHVLKSPVPDARMLKINSCV